MSEDSHPFSHAHDPQWLDNGHLLLFTTSSTGLASGAVEYELNTDSSELVEVWSYGMDDGPFALFLGQATRLANGNTLVNFGAAGQIREVTPDGSVVWQISLPGGQSFAQARLIDELPDSRP